MILSDHVYVQSENIRTQYINALSSFAGIDTKSFRAKKITPKPELFRSDAEPNSHDKKELLFCIAPYERMEHRALFEHAISERVDLMTQKSDNIHVTICDYPDDSPDPYVEKIAKNKGINIISYDLEYPDAFVSRFDAYYGSASPLVPYFANQKKPVMIADYEI